jgi:ATP-dependent Lhr-like helicase
LGDAANEAIACLLMSHGVQASGGRLGVEIQRASRSLEEIEDLLGDIGSEPAAPVDELLAKASNLVRQKWDGLLSPHLLRQSYASSNLDLGEALAWLRATFESRSFQGSGDT